MYDRISYPIWCKNSAPNTSRVQFILRGVRLRQSPCSTNASCHTRVNWNQGNGQDKLQLDQLGCRYWCWLIFSGDCSGEKGKKRGISWLSMESFFLTFWISKIKKKRSAFNMDGSVYLKTTAFWPNAVCQETTAYNISFILIIFINTTILSEIKYTMIYDVPEYVHQSFR